MMRGESGVDGSVWRKLAAFTLPIAGALVLAVGVACWLRAASRRIMRDQFGAGPGELQIESPEPPPTGIDEPLEAGNGAGGDAGTKVLAALKWEPRWMSEMGCLLGCLNYLPVDASCAWVYGVSGVAFTMNIHGTLCPSGPTAWDKGRVYALVKNLGCRLEGVVASKSDRDIDEKRRQAWELIKAAIDDNVPCYGWELDVPEYYVIKGYSKEGYVFNGCTKADEVKPWRSLADSGIGMLDVLIVRKSVPPDDKTAVREALSFAIEYSRTGGSFSSKEYEGGLGAYDLWMESLGANKADASGAAYNAQVWAECREAAPVFLEEAKARLGKELGPVFDEAIGHYRVTAARMTELAKTFPFRGVSEEDMKRNFLDGARRARAAELLSEAKTAEEEGLVALERLVAALEQH